MLVSMTQPLRVLTIELLGGHPVLDFINTLDWRDREAQAGGPVELLVSYDALLAWTRRLNLVGAEEAEALAAEAIRDAAAANAVLEQAKVLREAVFRLLAAAKTGQDPADDDLTCVNSLLAAAPATLQVSPKNGGYSWVRRQAAAGLQVPVIRLAHLAAELLTSDHLDRIHRCAGPGCGWLFLDTSPNRRRRWCSMEACGNRAKARRHYQRVKRQADL